MNRLTGKLAISLLTLASLGEWALAEPPLRLPAEISGTRQVMQVLRHVNLSRSEQKATQGLQDIFDVKSQLYSQNPQLTPINATASVAGHVPKRSGQSKQVPARYRMPYRR